MESINNLVVVKSNAKLKMTPEGDFFKCWTEFLRPIHKLTDREMDVLAEFLKVRYQLKKVIIDEDTLDRVLMSGETKRSIRKTCGVSVKHLQVIMCKFRKNGVIMDGKINPNIIPLVTDEGVGLLIHFSFKDEQHIKFGSQKGVEKP